MNQPAFLDLHDLDEDYLRGWVARVQGTTSADVKRFARE